MYATLVPAYGRRVTSGKAAKADWLDGKDFRFHSGQYCSVRDAEILKRNGFTHVELATAERGTLAIVKL